MSTSNEVSLNIDGMSCGHCVASVKKAIATVSGVSDAVVSVGAARLTVSAGSPEQITAEAIRAIQQAGYIAVPSSLGVASAPLAPTSCCSAPRPQQLARS
jgi:copper chaperone CopZ